MNGWVEKRLGEVCTLQRGFDLPTKQRKEGDYPLISSSGYIDSQAEAKISGPGVVTGRSGSIGSVFFVDKDFWPLNTTLYVKDFHGNDPRFIFHLLRKFNLKRFASGAGVPTLNRNSVHSELVYIPTNVSDQKKIVAILDEVFEGIDRAIANTERNLINSRELFKSSLQFVFFKRGQYWIYLQLSELLERKWITSHLDGNHGGDYPKKDEFVNSGVPYMEL
ncbi:MAG TPA: restriction endonuclease subunit S [Stenomitos sp.]